MRLRAAAIVAVLGAASPVLADPINLVGQPFRGRYKFVFVGASMADALNPTVLTNGVHCLKSSATTVVSAADIPSRAKLLQATLYVSGSLLDDGPDSNSPVQVFFDGQGRRFDDPDDRDFLNQLARNEADRRVMFKPPQAQSAIEVQAPVGAPKVAIDYIGSGPEMGNVAFFTTPIDVTNVINDEGRAVLFGTYEVSDLFADVCNGLEASCDDMETCGAVSRAHTKGNASFALLLIIEDPTLPFSSIAIYEGMQQLNNFSLDLHLDEGIAISDPPAGQLALYVLEGDLSLGDPNPGASPCPADEYVEVDGDFNPTVGGTCLVDDDNRNGNLFNSTINTQPSTGPVSCPGGMLAHECCVGDGLCGETGVDIDQFDISGALTPSATDVRVTIGTGSDQIALASIIVGVSIFEPILDQDSQIRILSLHTAANEVLLGGRAVDGEQLVLSLAISNTGNVRATDVAVVMDAPPFIEAGSFGIQSVPAGSVNNSRSDMGANGTGAVDVRGFSIEPGEVAEIRVEMITTCEALEKNLRSTMTISADGVNAFQIDSTDIIPRGPGVSLCAGIDPTGPFLDQSGIPPRRLRGAGGCTAASDGLAAAAGLMLVLARRRRRARGGRRDR